MSDTTRFQREHGPVTSELLVRMATLLNDYNPAHYDLDFAHEIGMPGVIGPGTLLQGWILSDIEAAAGASSPAAPHRVREIDLRFRAPFVVGDTVTIDYELDGDSLRAEVRATDGGAEPRMVAVATVKLAPERETGSVPERETGSVPEREAGS
jgi:acyl dehydratase